MGSEMCIRDRSRAHAVRRARAHRRRRRPRARRVPDAPPAHRRVQYVRRSHSLRRRPHRPPPRARRHAPGRVRGHALLHPGARMDPARVRRRPADRVCRAHRVDARPAQRARGCERPRIAGVPRRLAPQARGRRPRRAAACVPGALPHHAARRREAAGRRTPARGRTPVHRPAAGGQPRRPRDPRCPAARAQRRSRRPRRPRRRRGPRGR